MELIREEWMTARKFAERHNLTLEKVCHLCITGLLPYEISIPTTSHILVLVNAAAYDPAKPLPETFTIPAELNPLDLLRDIPAACQGDVS